MFPSLFTAIFFNFVEALPEPFKSLIFENRYRKKVHRVVNSSDTTPRVKGGIGKRNRKQESEMGRHELLCMCDKIISSDLLLVQVKGRASQERSFAILFVGEATTVYLVVSGCLFFFFFFYS